MRRREFIAALGSAVAWPTSGRAQARRPILSPRRGSEEPVESSSRHRNCDKCHKLNVNNRWSGRSNNFHGKNLRSGVPYNCAMK